MGKPPEAAIFRFLSSALAGMIIFRVTAVKACFGAFRALMSSFYFVLRLAFNLLGVTMRKQASLTQIMKLVSWEYSRRTPALQRQATRRINRSGLTMRKIQAPFRLDVTLNPSELVPVFDRGF
jgi:hypothetical protein